MPLILSWVLGKGAKIFFPILAGLILIAAVVFYVKHVDHLATENAQMKLELKQAAASATESKLNTVKMLGDQEEITSAILKTQTFKVEQATQAATFHGALAHVAPSTVCHGSPAIGLVLDQLRAEQLAKRSAGH